MRIMFHFLKNYTPLYLLIFGTIQHAELGELRTQHLGPAHNLYINWFVSELIDGIYRIFTNKLRWELILSNNFFFNLKEQVFIIETQFAGTTQDYLHYQRTFLFLIFHFAEYSDMRCVKKILLQKNALALC